MDETNLSSLKKAIESYIPMGRSGLLPALHAAQNVFGWVSEPVAEAISKALRVPLADVHGVIEFYSLFYNKPTSKHVIRVCTDVACSLKGGDGILQHLCSHHGLEADPAGGFHQTKPDLSLTIEPSPCLGLCEHAPAALVANEAETNIDLKNNSYELGRPPSRVYGSIRSLTANCGNGTTSLAQYGNYAALIKAKRLNPANVIAEIKASGLVGRGGAAFPTGIKWEGAANAPADQKFVICNADESEPGTFKDRILLLDDPHRMIEGMCIAAYAIGATRGYIYIRGEYPYIVPVLENALKEARNAGYLGEDFDMEVRVGAGAYICGEETALFESIEGKRGFPRVKPPFPTTYGLFGKPTVINNVETLCNVPLIILNGSAEYRKIGTEKSPGPKLLCVSGDVSKPGLYEIPFGVTLRELLDMAGGVAGGRQLQSVLFGGAAGAFAISSHQDVRMTFEDLRTAGLPLGSGVVMVFDETRDMRKVLRSLGHFFAHESCGKCYPCQMGTRRQKEILDRVADGRSLPDDMLRLQDVGWTMTDASLCGLGQTAASAVLSAIKLWPGLFTPGSENQISKSNHKEADMVQVTKPEPEAPKDVPQPKPEEASLPVVVETEPVAAPKAVKAKRTVKRATQKAKTTKKAVKKTVAKKVAKKAKPKVMKKVTKAAKKKTVAKKSSKK